MAFLGFEYFGSKTRSLEGVSLVLALFVCVVLHELGHAFAAARYGIRTASITLYPIGGVAALQEMPAPRKELWIALAGPAVNVLIAGLTALYLKSTGHPIIWSPFMDPTRSFAQNLLSANLLLAVFNMAPAFPMDGGRVLRAIIARFVDETIATGVAARIGQFVAVLFGLYGLYTGQFLTIFIAIFVWFGAGQEAAHFQTRALLVGHRIREAMVREFHTLPVGATLGEAAALLLAGNQQDFPILSGTEIAGVLSRSDLLQGMAVSGKDAYVAAAMNREFLSALPDDPLDSLLSGPLTGPILVLKDGAPTDTSLIGMVTQENLLEFLAINQVERVQSARH